MLQLPCSAAFRDSVGDFLGTPVEDVDAALAFPKSMLRRGQFSTLVDLDGTEDQPSIDAIKTMVLSALSGATVVLLYASRKTRKFISDAMALPELRPFTDHLEIVDIVPPHETSAPPSPDGM